MSSSSTTTPRAVQWVAVGLPWAVVLVLALSLVVSRRSFDHVSAAYDAFRARVDTTLTNQATAGDSAVQVGLLVPDVAVIGSDGRERGLRALPMAGYEFIYLYREDCQGCQDLLPAIMSMSGQARQRFAQVRYSPGEDLNPELGGSMSFAVLARTSRRAYPLTKYVPALIQVRTDGRVLAVADGTLEVVRLLSLNDLVAPDSLVVAGIPLDTVLQGGRP